jgi:hypothetical protein
MKNAKDLVKKPVLCKSILASILMLLIFYVFTKEYVFPSGRGNTSFNSPLLTYIFLRDPGKTPPGVNYKSPQIVKNPNFGGKKGLRFAMFGDWGVPTDVLKNVSDNLDILNKDLKKRHEGLNAVLLSGDNFYRKGVTGLDDPRWEQLWGKPFRRTGLPFYVSLGNHDYGFGPKNAQYQVQKSGTKGFENWILRDENGEAQIGIYFAQWFMSEDFACQVCFIDTSLLLVNRLRVHKKWGEQLHWLSKKLDEKVPDKGKGKTIVRMVVGHHVIECFGEKEAEVRYINHKNNRVGPNGTNLKDIISQKADVYLCGHAHTVEYVHLGGKDVAPKQGPIHGKERVLDKKVPLQLISGTGGAVRQTSYWSESCYYVARLPGFTVVSLEKSKDRTSLRAHFVDCRKAKEPRFIYSLNMPLELKTGAKPKKKFFK